MGLAFRLLTLQLSDLRFLIGGGVGRSFHFRLSLLGVPEGRLKLHNLFFGNLEQT